MFNFTSIFEEIIFEELKRIKYKRVITEQEEKTRKITFNRD